MYELQVLFGLPWEIGRLTEIEFVQMPRPKKKIHIVGFPKFLISRKAVESRLEFNNLESSRERVLSSQNQFQWRESTHKPFWNLEFWNSNNDLVSFQQLFRSNAIAT